MLPPLVLHIVSTTKTADTPGLSQTRCLDSCTPESQTTSCCTHGSTPHQTSLRQFCRLDRSTHLHLPTDDRNAKYKETRRFSHASRLQPPDCIRVEPFTTSSHKQCHLFQLGHLSHTSFDPYKPYKPYKERNVTPLTSDRHMRAFTEESSAMRASLARHQTFCPNTGA